MTTKQTWKIGEYAKGGIISVEIKGEILSIIGKEWDMSKGCKKSSNQTNAKEFTRSNINVTENYARRKADDFLNDLTSSYYADKILTWIETKVKLGDMMTW